MAIGTYSELQASIASWMHKTNLTAIIPDCIALAESRINTLLMSKKQDVAGTIATAAGVQTALLPSDLVSAHSLSIATVSPSLDFLTPDQLENRYDPQSVGAPKAYAVVGTTIYFGPTPDAAYSIRCIYRSYIPALSDDAPTNSMLTKWPNIYLWGALVEAAKYSRDPELQQSFNQDFLAAIDGVNVFDWHSAGPMRIRSDVRSV